MNNSIYTRSERTVRKYTVGQAVASAERRLNQAGVKGMCMNAVRAYQRTDSITLEELNRIADAIYDDSVYWGGHL